MIRALLSALGAVPIAIMALQGCTAMKSGSDRARSTIAAIDAGVDVLGAPACGHRSPPSRPHVTGSGGSIDVVFAVSHASYGYALSSVDDAGRPAYLGFGFDLDNACTGEGQGPSCIEPAWASADHTDGVDGIDNAAGQAVALEVPLGFDQASTTEAMANQIIRVRGYSGEPDDDQVDVTLYAGFGLAPREDGGTGLLWDGHDPWMILPDTLAPLEDDGAPGYDLDQPLFHDENAYVSQGVLVARLPEALWPTGLDAAPSSLQRVAQLVLAGNLVRVGEQWELQHIMTGLRDPVKTVLAIGARTAPQGGQPICQSASQYLMIKRRMCSFVDIASGPDSPTSPCDAMSGGSLLEAKQAVLGGIGPKAEGLPAVCAPGVDPDNDSCDPTSNP